MSNFNETASNWTPRLHAILRIVLAILFIGHGLVKLFGFPDGAQPGQVPLLSLFGIAGLFELFGGAAILVGLFTRPVAFLLSGEMAIAYFMVHAPQGFYPVINGGELAIIYAFAFLYLAAAGAGPWSIDARRGA